MQQTENSEKQSMTTPESSTDTRNLNDCSCGANPDYPPASLGGHMEYSDVTFGRNLRMDLNQIHVYSAFLSVSLVKHSITTFWIPSGTHPYPTM